MNEDVIRAEGLTNVLNQSLVAVDRIKFSVREGEIFGFLVSTALRRQPPSTADNAFEADGSCCRLRFQPHRQRGLCDLSVLAGFKTQTSRSPKM